jgi:hypothetical protein
MLTALSALYLTENHLTGSIPSEFAYLPLVDLDLSGNGLRGSIPPNLFHLNGTLDNLILSNNSFTGTIPSTVGLFSGSFLAMHRNAFTGTLPLELFNVENMEVLVLGSPDVSIPIICMVWCTCVNSHDDLILCIFYSS